MRSIAKKLRIREDSAVFPINAPPDYRKSLGPLPPRVKMVSNGDGCDQVHWFVRDRAQMERELKGVLQLLQGERIVWIFYPKGSSKIQTDLTRDKGWESLLRLDNLQWLSLVSFDDTWSTFACRLKTVADRKKEAVPKKREIFDWIDPEKKIVRLPGDFATALKKLKLQQAFFDALSFTNRKEYVEWIITAKRPETRAERINNSLERLTKGWKNPRNL